MNRHFFWFHKLLPSFSLIWRNEFSLPLSWWLWCNWVNIRSNNVAAVEAWTQLCASNTSCNTWTLWLSFSVSARHITRFVRFGLACVATSTPSTNDWFFISNLLATVKVFVVMIFTIMASTSASTRSTVFEARTPGSHARNFVGVSQTAFAYHLFLLYLG